jgi:peptidyl-tRNA hydrolase
MLVESVFRKNEKNLLNKYKQWSSQGMKKVILKCKEKELANLMKSHECEYVLDEGLTEIKSGSLTVVGVLPTYERFFEFKLL